MSGARRSRPPRRPRAPAPRHRPSPLDTTTWVPYTSGRYGFEISHPADWALEGSADHDWALPGDADFPNTGTEHFTYSPAADGQGIGVSAWSVAVEPGTTVEAGCRPTARRTRSCDALPNKGSAVTMDGHPGSLYYISGWPHAAFLVDDRIYVVACWRSDDDAAVAMYGGSRSLVEAFVSTMRLTPGGPAPSP